VKRGTFPGLRFDRDTAAVALDDFLADGQPDASASELIPFVQPLEHAENPFEVLRIDSQAVVFYREVPFLAAILDGGNVYAGHSQFLVLDGIANEILKQLSQLSLVGQDGW
jgi:hypothetical protein